MTSIAALSKALAPKTGFFSSRPPKDEVLAKQVAETLQAHGESVANLSDKDRDLLIDIASQVLAPRTPNQAGPTPPGGLSLSCAQAAKSLVPPETMMLYQKALANHRQAATPMLATFNTMMVAAKAANRFEVPQNLVTGDYAEKEKLKGKRLVAFNKICAEAAENDPEIRDLLKSESMQGTATLTIANYAPIYMTKALFSGGFGQVRLGLLDNVLVAVKVLTIEAGKKGRGPTMLTPEQEARKELEYLQLLGAKTQPLVAALVKGSSERSRLFIVMAYQQGELGDLFASLPNNKLKRSATLATLVSLADQGKRLAGAQLMHGDIKPANILYDHKGNIGLSDMGLVHELDSGLMRHLGTRGLSGTPEYLPYEVHKPSFNGMLVDMWAVGATLWSSVVGAPPIPWCPKGANRFTHAGEMADLFNHWQRSIAPMTTAERRAEAEERSASSLPQANKHLYAGYMHLIEVLGEPLAEMVTFKLMNHDPQARGSWREIEKASKRMLKESHEKAAQEQLLGSIRGAAKVKKPRDRAVNVVLQAHKMAMESVKE